MRPRPSPQAHSGSGLRSIRLGQVLSILVGLVAPLAVLGFYLNPDPFAIPPIIVASLVAGSISIVAIYIDLWRPGNLIVKLVGAILLASNIYLLGITIGALLQLSNV